MRFLRCFLAALFVFSVAQTANAIPIHKLWVAIRGNACANCKATIDNYLSCVFDDTNFRAAFLGSYPTGIDLVLGGTKVIGTDCGQYNYQCVENEAGFPVADDDVLMYVWGADYCVGGENQRGYSIVVNGKTVHPRTGWIDAQGCDCITPILLHEIYEAANDQDSADCCNGQNGGNGYGYAYNPVCGQKYGANGNVAPWGWFYFQCPNGKFRTQYLAPYPKKGDANACASISLGCPMGGMGKQLHAACNQASECCPGLSCENWVVSGNDPLTPRCCEGIGASCVQASDCCGGSDCDTMTHKCICVPKDGWCINANECCNGFVCDINARKCVVAPPMPEPMPEAGASDAASQSDAGPGTGDAEFQVPPPGGCQCNAAENRPSPLIALLLGAWILRRRRTHARHARAL